MENDPNKKKDKSKFNKIIFDEIKKHKIELDKKIKIISKIVIGADGIESRVGRWGNIKTSVRMKDMESCLQYTVSNIDINQEQMVMYVGSNFAPGGYMWIFPKGEGSANIGIGISGKYSKKKSAKKYLDEFIKLFKHGLASDILRTLQIMTEKIKNAKISIIHPEIGLCIYHKKGYIYIYNFEKYGFARFDF